MWKLEDSARGWAVVRTGKSWARVVGSLLLVLYSVIVLVGLMLSPADAVTFAAFFAIPLLVPGVLVWRLLGRTITRRPTAILEARDVAGGTLVTVVDDANKRHDFITDHPSATALADALRSRA